MNELLAVLSTDSGQETALKTSFAAAALGLIRTGFRSVPPELGIIPLGLRIFPSAF